VREQLPDAHRANTFDEIECDERFPGFHAREISGFRNQRKQF
jgi:hypothetical protein